jgi:hypothetical protein
MLRAHVYEFMPVMFRKEKKRKEKKIRNEKKVKSPLVDELMTVCIKN